MGARRRTEQAPRRFHVGNCMLAMRSVCQRDVTHPQFVSSARLGANMGALTFGTKRFRRGVLLTATLLAWPVTGWAYTADQQQACMPDAFRLCGSEIPDVSRVTACMVRRQAELSPECRVNFRPEPAAESVRPLVHKAARARKLRQARRHAPSDG